LGGPPQSRRPLHTRSLRASHGQSVQSSRDDTRNSQRFSDEIRALLGQVDEVQIEPRAADGQSVGRVTIWVVLVDGNVYVRSYRGPTGRWYQALLRHATGVLHVDGRNVPFRAVRVEDQAEIARVSEAYRRKYEHKWPKETAEMLRDEVLPTTLRLEPEAPSGSR
jgi:hypothetical protein